jgi:UDP-N-acetylglucosamine:LPS N-acetylglucosamine transferase
VISASGYNSFHELLRCGVPSIFVPNENPDMDNQLARATFADRHGLGKCVRRSEIYKIRHAIDCVRDEAFIEGMRDRSKRLVGDGDGARQAAAIVEEFYYSARADR